MFESASGQYITPTFKFSADKSTKHGNLSNAEKIENGIKKAVQILIKFFKANFKNPSSLGYKVYLDLSNNKDKIINSIFNKQISIFPSPEKGKLSLNSFLTIKIDDRFAAEINKLVEKTITKILESRFKFGKTPLKEKKKCSLCHSCSRFLSGNVRKPKPEVR
ncbi:MAG: hypothetical protein ACTSRA_22415 [Promethearchaeota archaeon]